MPGTSVLFISPPTHMHTHTHAYTHTCIHTHAYTHMHTHTHTHTHAVTFFGVSSCDVGSLTAWLPQGDEVLMQRLSLQLVFQESKAESEGFLKT
jgi:hypothetical protein